MLFQQWSLEFWLHIPWTMSFLMMTVTFGAKENWCKIQQRTLINPGPRADFICCYATDCVTYILCGKASFVFLLFPPPSCKQAIIAKHSPKFSWLRNAGFVTIQSMNPSLLNRWHVMLLDCNLPPFSLFSLRVTICREFKRLNCWEELYGNSPILL